MTPPELLPAFADLLQCVLHHLDGWVVVDAGVVRWWQHQRDFTTERLRACEAARDAKPDERLAAYDYFVCAVPRRQEANVPSKIVSKAARLLSLPPDQTVEYL